MGRVSNVAEDHIGLLVFGYFHVSIPEHLMPAKFVHKPEQECWALPGSEVTISAGDMVQFTVHKYVYLIN